MTIAKSLSVPSENKTNSTYFNTHGSIFGGPCCHAEQWPVYYVDPEESSIGPEGLTSLYEEWYDEKDVEENNYDGDGSYEQEPLETSASQRVDPDETTQAETVSGHTQHQSIGLGDL